MDKVFNVGKKLALMFVTGLVMIMAIALFFSIVLSPLILHGLGAISGKVAIIIFIVILSLLFGSAYYDDF